MGYGVVDEGSPSQDEYYERAELDPTYEGARYQRWRDYSEHRLEYHVGKVRNSGPVVGVRFAPDASEDDPFEVTDDPPSTPVWTEGQAVPVEDPLNRDQADDYEALANRREGMLPTNEAAIEETQGGRHDHYEGGRRKEPSRVSAGNCLVTATDGG